jgi:hypothetical protein
MEVVRGIWPVMISLFLSGVVGIMVFPFFTYVPSSGWLNDLLPKVVVCTAHKHVPLAQVCKCPCMLYQSRNLRAVDKFP